MRALTVLFFGVFTTLVGISAHTTPAWAVAGYGEATKIGPPKTSIPSCGKSEFWDPKGGGACWTCSGKARTASPVDSNRACRTNASETLSGATRKSTDNLKCPSGSFHDPRNGGECWTCPKGTTRTAHAVNGRKACTTKATERFSKASRKSKDNLKCTGGSFHDPRNGGECWKCPKNTKRTVHAVNGKKACSKRINKKGKKASYDYDTGSILKACKSGTFANLGETKCYKCDSGYKHDGTKKVNQTGVCFKPAYTSHHKATKIKSLKGFKCKKGQFFDAKHNGSCWTCPKNYSRTGHGVSGKKACVKRTPARHKSASLVKAFKGFKCAKGQFFDAINNGSCWTCPKNFRRTAYKVNTKKACVRTNPARFSKARKIRKAPLRILDCTAHEKDAFLDVPSGNCWKCPKANPKRTLFPVISGRACGTKACGRRNTRPCLVSESPLKCIPGLMEDPISNTCVLPTDLPCTATLGAIKVLKDATDKALKKGEAIEEKALDAIPGARAFLTFMQVQGEHMMAEQSKLMNRVKIKQVGDQLKALVTEHADPVGKLIEVGQAMNKVKTRLMDVVLDPNVMCSKDPQAITNKLKSLGLQNVFTGITRSKEVHRMAVKLMVKPPLPPKWNGLAFGLGFATDFDKNHTLSLPITAYGKVWPLPPKTSVKSLGDITLNVGWSYWDGVTDWGRNDIFNWGSKVSGAGTVHVLAGAGGFSGIDLTIMSLTGQSVPLDVFGVSKTTVNFKPPRLNVGGGVGGAFGHKM